MIRRVQIHRLSRRSHHLSIAKRLQCFVPAENVGKSTTLKSNKNFSIFARRRPSARFQFSGYFAIALRQSSCVQVRN